MGDATKIEWTDATWNPLRGCSRVSEGCRNCYAERVAARFSGPGMAYDGLAKMTDDGPRWTGKIALVEEHLQDPIRWKRPRRIFVNSMSDLFHENVPDEMIDRIFSVMAAAPQHTFQVLTKRPGRMLAYMTSPGRASKIGGWCSSQVRNNIWLGVSAEDQSTWESRVEILRRVPAAVRWVSAEPLIGPIAPEPWELAGIDWVVAGGESGPHARKMDAAWAREMRDRCEWAGVPFFFKQWGEWAENGRKVGKLAAGRVLDGREWNEYPAAPVLAK